MVTEVPRSHVDDVDLEVTEEEFRLIREMEAQDVLEKRAIAQAAEEYEMLQNSQEREDERLLEEMANLVEARKYREWEEWEFQNAMEQGTVSSLQPGRRKWCSCRFW